MAHLVVAVSEKLEVLLARFKVKSLDLERQDAENSFRLRHSMHVCERTSTLTNAFRTDSDTDRCRHLVMGAMEEIAIARGDSNRLVHDLDDLDDFCHKLIDRLDIGDPKPWHKPEMWRFVKEPIHVNPDPPKNIFTTVCSHPECTNPVCVEARELRKVPHPPPPLLPPTRIPA